MEPNSHSDDFGARRSVLSRELPGERGASDEHAAWPSGLEPRDEHNRRLRDNVRPSDWPRPEPPSRYNLVVIGAGAAGLISASIAAGLGARVALIERHLLGGDCLNVGCVPSKALIRAARAAAEVRDAGRFGVRVPSGVDIDFAAVMERMRRLRASISPNDSADRYRVLGVDVYFGNGSFAGPDSVEVDGLRLRFHRCVIATGARAALPPIPGLSDVDCLTNESVFSLTELPRRLAIIGAGPIGCELAQAFARFGSRVHLIEARHGVLPNEDRDAAQWVRDALVRDGVTVHCCGKELIAAPLRRSDDDATPRATRLTFDSHGAGLQLDVDRVLVGAGRRPNVEGMNLEAAGVGFDQTGVLVDDRLRTTNRRVFAAGDICSRFKFTHAADAMARIVVQNALFGGRSRVSRLTIPWCTYTDPEVAHVGMYEDEVRRRFGDVQTYVQPLAEVDRAILDDQAEGFVKVHTRPGSDRIRGATIVASHAGDLISQVTAAMVGGLRLGNLSRTIHPYPTQAEAIRKIGDAYNRTRLKPWIKRWMETWFAWTR